MTLNYIDLTSVLAIDKSQGLTRTTQQHTTSGQTFALTEIQTCPLSTLKVANVQISASLSHVPPPAELIVIVQYSRSKPPLTHRMSSFKRQGRMALTTTRTFAFGEMHAPHQLRIKMIFYCKRRMECCCAMLQVINYHVRNGLLTKVRFGPYPNGAGSCSLCK